MKSRYPEYESLRSRDQEMEQGNGDPTQLDGERPVDCKATHPYGLKQISMVMERQCHILYRLFSVQFLNRSL